MYKNIDYLEERIAMKDVYGVDTMCTAKFLSSTIYLQTGQTHSCYHPQPHNIPIEELVGNPSALHNTTHKKERRKQMLNGKRPAECNYCWRVEDMGDEHISDRIIKSKNELLMTEDAHGEIIKKGWDYNYQPTYLEISFGNECNMKCAYCHPKASSAWQKEMVLYGPMKNAPSLQQLEETIYREENNPYLDAFWKWWVDLRESLKVLRLTGGEPLLQQSIWRFLDMLDEFPCPDLILQVNSNLNIKNLLVKRFCDKVNKLLDEDKIKSFQMFSSLESWGERAVYARNGLDLELWEENLDTIMTEFSKQTIVKFPGIIIMNTFNIMSVTSYVKFLKKILYWRTKYNTVNETSIIKFDIPHCTEPSQWALLGLPDDYDSYFTDITAFFKKNAWDNNKSNYEINDFHNVYFLYFNDEEIKSWDRVHSHWQQIKIDRASIVPPEHLTIDKIDDARRNWSVFINETDQRRNTNFLKVFPEMTSYYDLTYKLLDLATTSYNQYIKKSMMQPSGMEVHIDDDFFYHHPSLAHNLIEYRKIKMYTTKIYDNDTLIDEF